MRGVEQSVRFPRKWDADVSQIEAWISTRFQRARYSIAKIYTRSGQTVFVHPTCPICGLDQSRPPLPTVLRDHKANTSSNPVYTNFEGKMGDKDREGTLRFAPQRGFSRPQIVFVEPCGLEGGLQVFALNVPRLRRSLTFVRNLPHVNTIIAPDVLISFLRFLAQEVAYLA